MRCPLRISTGRYGNYGSNNDSGVFRNPTTGKRFFENRMNLPDPEVKINDCSRNKIPYYLVGDEAFLLQPWILRRYLGKNIFVEDPIFNYRLSRARLVIENSFGILAARWRIFLQPIQSNVKNVNAIVRAAICLHTFLRQTNSAAYYPKGFTDTYDSTGQIKEAEWRATVKFNDGLLKDIHGV